VDLLVLLIQRPKADPHFHMRLDDLASGFSFARLSVG